MTVFGRHFRPGRTGSEDAVFEHLKLEPVSGFRRQNRSVVHLLKSIKNRANKTSETTIIGGSAFRADFGAKGGHLGAILNPPGAKVNKQLQNIPLL